MVHHNFKISLPHKLEYKSQLHFQEGPIKEIGVNGFANEDVILAVLLKLRCFQDGPYVCDENAEAIKHLENALAAMNYRTQKRLNRNVEGTSTI